MLDVACGQGRHVRWFAARGHSVVGIDRSQPALDALADLGVAGAQPQVITHCADIENAPWPLMRNGAVQTFAGVVVTNYLWRALLPTVLGSVAEGGVLLYETFAQGNGSVGKPSRPDFLLQPGELLQACRGLRVVAFEEGFCANPPRFVQRIAAVREPAATATPHDGVGAPWRYAL